MKIYHRYFNKPRWEDPPPPTCGRRVGIKSTNRKHLGMWRLYRILEMLKKAPKKWAMITDKGVSTAYTMRLTYPDYEFTQRGPSRGPFKTYARYMGKKK